MPHWLNPLNLYSPRTWSLPHSCTFSNHIQYHIRHSSPHTQLIFLPYTVFECRHNIRNQPISTTIPSPSSFCDITTIRKHKHFGEIFKYFFLMFFKTVSHIAKHSLYVQLLQVCLSIIHLRILSFSQVKFSLWPRQTSK